MQLVGRNKAAYSANLLHAVRRNTRSFIGRAFARPVGYCALRAQVGHRGMSVVPLKADIDWKGRHVRKVPKAGFDPARRSCETFAR